MVILHLITRLNQGGTAIWLGHLMRELPKFGQHVVLAAGQVSPGETEDPLFAEVGGIRLPALQRGVNFRKDLEAFLQVRRLVQDIKPDIINTHTSKAGVVGRIAALSLGSKRPVIIHTYHGHILYGYFGRFVSAFVTLTEKLLSQVTDHFIISGTQVLRDLQTKHVVKQRNCTVVRPGVTPIQRMPKSQARRLLGISPEQFVVGWMGRFEPIKRPDRVVELAKNNRNFTFVAAGDGSLFAGIKSLHLPNLILPGWTSAQVVWSAADIAISTSDNEAQPIALVEAGLCELALIGFDVGSIADVIHNNVNGYVVSSLRELESRVKELHFDRERMIELGKSAKIHGDSDFSVIQFVRAHRDTYQDTL